MRPTAIVMNLFYTGLGVARSLGEKGIRVVGLSAHKGAYGNFSRYAEVRVCPDSREAPDALLTFLLELGEELRGPAVIFPTRDDDLTFLDRFRERLQGRFRLIIAERVALEACLDKWLTYQVAREVDVPSPRSWLIQSEEELLRVAPMAAYPVVLKPVSASHWRRSGNWEKVLNRKAVGVFSATELITEYGRIADSEPRALIQEMVPGPDDCLQIAACYLDSESNVVAGFTARKLLQVPDGFGTGCIVQSINCPELLVLAGRLLKKMHFSGIAEVEFKWDAQAKKYKLIEVNPRPWDQHRLGNACGTDLIHIAFCQSAALPTPPAVTADAEQKWIAEDTYVRRLIQSLWRRDGQFGQLLRLARGRRVYAVWSLRDPLPFIGYMALTFVPEFATAGFRYSTSWMRHFMSDRVFKAKGVPYEKHLEDASSKD